MADTNAESHRLAHLRALAQHHLTEIEIDKAQEEAQLSQAEAEIQRYSKMPSFDRKKHASSTSSRPQPEEQSPQAAPESPMELSKPRLRPFQEILHRLRWDPKFDIGDYVVGYLERFEGIKEMPASSWIKDFSDEEWIPMHRVRYVKRVKMSGKDDEGLELGMVWDRDGRVDKISRTTDGTVGTDDRTDILSIDGTSVTGGMTL